MHILGTAGELKNDQADNAAEWIKGYMFSYSGPIYAGTNEIQKNIIYNSLQESLSKFYTLTSTKMYEKAEEEAFQQVDANECTEAQCIAIIQELLQVELFFLL